MTQGQFETRLFFGQIQPPVTSLRFRFFGSDHWWTEYFDARPYQKRPEGFRMALSPFCEFDHSGGN